MNVLLSRLGNFCATYKSKTPYGIYSGEWVNLLSHEQRLIPKEHIYRLKCVTNSKYNITLLVFFDSMTHFVTKALQSVMYINSQCLMYKETKRQ